MKRFWAVLGVVASMSAVAFPMRAKLDDNDRVDFILPSVDRLIQRAEVTLLEGNVGEAEAILGVIAGPVKVGLDLSTVPEERRAEIEGAFAESKTLWQEVVPGQPLFEVVPIEKAQVRVQLADRIDFQSAQVAGRAMWQRNVSRLGRDGFFGVLRADIVVRTCFPDGQKFGHDALVHTFAHELGHVLGLDDNPHLGQIMGPMNPVAPTAQLGVQDIEGLQAIQSVAGRIQAGIRLARMTDIRNR